MHAHTPLWVAPALLLSAATLSLADEVSLVGDYRLTGPALSGHVQIDGALNARLLTGGGEQVSPVRLEGDVAVLSPPGQAPLVLSARADGGFDVAGGGRLIRQGTFVAADVERAKVFLEANAKAFDNLDCITTVNHAVRLLFSDPSVRVGSQQDRTMNGLVEQGLADRPLVIEFLNEKGKKTTGVTEPVKLQESVFQALRTMAKGDRGWSVFGLSIMDGYHSVLLFLDTNDPADPKVYWADQWSSKGGFKEYTGEGLDTEIEAKTKSWWSDTKKPRSRTTLWRVRPHARGHVQVATVRASRLSLRSGPGTEHERLGFVRRGDAMPVLAEDGAWRQVRSPEGDVVWAHGGYLRAERGVPTGQGLRVGVGGITAALGY